MKIYARSDREPLHGYVLGDFIEEESVFLSGVLGFGHCRFSP